MAEVTGPISTLPNAIYDVPKEQMCDVHLDRPAIVRIQGETDSFGCELHDCCEECADKIRNYNRSSEARTGKCNWCKREATDLRYKRDYEEGMNGPVYRVCGVCCKRREEEDRMELDQYRYDC